MMTPRLFRRSGFLVAAALAAALFSGCVLVVAGAAGAGTVAYVEGELRTTVGKNYERVCRASVKAVDQLQFHLISEAKDALSDTITARTGQDKKVTIVLKREAEGVTSVNIRVGIVGNEATSREIFNQIDRDL